MTLGLECIKFMLEQDPDNLPIVQRWMDKWFWRGYRLLGLVSMMMDYMLPKKVMSWRNGWEIYFEQNGGALFNDLARYGIRPPKYAEQATAEKDHLSHQLWSLFYQWSWGTGLHAWLPKKEEMDWLSKQYPDTFDKHYRPRFEYWRSLEERGTPFSNTSLGCLCQICQIPMVYTEVSDPTKISYRESEYNGDKYHFCSDGCKDIFDNEPEKYVQAWLPVQQMLQGTMGEDMYAYMHVGRTEGGNFTGSPDQVNWDKWKGIETVAG